jgi:hypothetical protein
MRRMVHRTAARTALAAVVSIALLAACKLKGKDGADAAAEAEAPDAAPVVVDAGPADAEVDAGPAQPAKAGPVQLPGACVDPVADAKVRATGPGPVVAMEPDLDGDGTKDKIVAFTSTGPASTFVAYVMRGKCGHFVGVLKAGTLEPQKSRSRGLSDLNAHVPCAAPKTCNCTTQDFTAKFDGRAYLAGVAREELVPCPPDAGAGVAADGGAVNPASRSSKVRQILGK